MLKLTEEMTVETLQLLQRVRQGSSQRRSNMLSCSVRV